MYDPTNDITAAATKYNLNLSWLRAQVQHESNFKPLAIGDGGRALGLMQVHEVAAEDVGMDAMWHSLLLAIIHGQEELAAKMSLEIGCAYLKKQLDKFGNLCFALMAYNQGPTVVGNAVAYWRAVESAVVPQ